jgi:plasmid stabilization system protein ParE
MARKPPRLKLVITPQAQRDIYQIWDYNCREYDSDHANSYIDFLDKETAKLKTEYSKGKTVPVNPDLRYQIMRKGRGHGHIAVYKIVADTVRVLHYFHTAQDWQGRLARGE